MCGRHCTSISPCLTDQRAHRPHCQAGSSELQKEVDFGLALIRAEGNRRGKSPTNTNGGHCVLPPGVHGTITREDPRCLVYAKDTQEAVQAGLARYLLNCVDRLRPEVPAS